MILEFLLTIIFTLFSIAIAVMDCKTETVPRIAFIVVFPVLFALRFLSNTGSFPYFSIIGMAIGLAVFLLAYALSKKKLGLADAWYSGIIGFVLGPLWWHAAVSIACVLGILYMVSTKKSKMPFIPLMAIGGIAANIIKGKMQ